MTAECIELLREMRIRQCRYAESYAQINDDDGLRACNARIAALDEAIRLVEATDAISAVMGEDGKIPHDGRWYVLSSRVRVVDDKLMIDAPKLEAEEPA